MPHGVGNSSSSQPQQVANQIACPMVKNTMYNIGVYCMYRGHHKGVKGGAPTDNGNRLQDC